MAARKFKKIDNRIFCFSLETPFPLGLVNVYFIADSRPTLIDTGPNEESVADALQQSLMTVGYHFADIKRILISHPHIDHFGLAARIKIESGAEVAAMAGAQPFLRNITKEWDANDQYFKHFLSYCGVPGQKISTLLAAGRDYVNYGCQVELDRPLNDGDRIEFDDFTLRVLHTPGHTMHDACFESPEHRLLFVGDTLRPRIAPSILLARPSSPETSRPRIAYMHMKSLKRLMNTTATLALPGHGEPFENPREAAEKTLRYHHRRCDDLFALLNGRARTPYELALDLSPELPDFELFLWISEVIGYLELLEEQGKVTQEYRDGQIYFFNISHQTK
ncbi:MAG: MBL fold metallo-hydrolase [Myxococcales bacterium]|nr:MBL fold metallo-hydrolase [Myxococcales bacterium]